MYTKHTLNVNYLLSSKILLVKRVYLLKEKRLLRVKLSKPKELPKINIEKIKVNKPNYIVKKTMRCMKNTKLIQEYKPIKKDDKPVKDWISILFEDAYIPEKTEMELMREKIRLIMDDWD